MVNVSFARPKKVNIKGYKRDDCTVIAMGNALGVSYDLGRKIMQTAMYDGKEFTFRKRNPLPKSEFMELRNVQAICKGLGVKELLFERYDSSKRITLEDFAKANNAGIYLVLVDHHLTTVVDGRVVDTYDSRKSKMIAAYKIDLVHSDKTIYELAKFYGMANKKHYVKSYRDWHKREAAVAA